MSPPSSNIVTDAEAQPSRAINKVSFYKHLTDKTGVTQAVIDYKYRGEGTVENPYLVGFLSEDTYNPMTFTNSRKWIITFIQAGATLAVTFSSSAYTGDVAEILHEFNSSREVATLGVSLFVLGFAVGPLIWAPCSEAFGRQILFFITYFALTAFNAAAAGAPSLAALVVLRFFAGAFGSSPLTNAGGVIADMFNVELRGIANSIFAMAPFLGPALGPIAGGFLGEAAGWRWVEGLTAAFTGTFWILSTLFYPETYAPVLLRSRAEELSKRTGKVYICHLDAGMPPKAVVQQLKVSLSRPWALLFNEPIVALISIYVAIIYGTLYMCFGAFPIVFGSGRGWSPDISGLAFCGIAAGMIFGTAGSICYNRFYIKIAAKSPGGMAPPEARLPPAIVGSILLPVGLFWFAWTNGPEIHWMVPIIGSVFFAAGIVLVFVSTTTYLVDSYVIFAASVLAANSLLRSLFGAAFPLFTSQMYSNLGIHWASSIPAFLTLACLPFPFLFYKYGDKIRARCKYAAAAAAILEKIRNESAAHAIDEDQAMEEAGQAEHQKHELCKHKHEC